MPGPRYLGWMHKRFRGDVDKAPAYLPEARKVLGFVVQEAERLGLMTYTLRRTLANGVQIIGELFGGQPRVTITVPFVPPNPLEVVPPEGFVTWPRDDDHVDGIDDTYPQVLLTPTWTTSFYNSTIAARVTVPKQPKFYGAEYPAGLKFAGNVDWRRDDGVRVSWYGPCARYWYDRWRQPSAQYGKFVFLLGVKLLDIDAYCTESSVDFAERLVLGAALGYDNHLYVLQAKIDDQPDPDAPFGRPGDVFSTTSYPTDPVQLRLVRYSAPFDGSQPFAQRVGIAPHSHVTLWSGTLAGAVNPWVFDPKIRTLETFALPDEADIRRYRNSDDTLSYDLPSTHHAHHTLTIDKATSTAALASANQSMPVNVTGGSCPIAADWTEKGVRVELSLAFEAFAAIPTIPIAEIPYVAAWAAWSLQSSTGKSWPLLTAETPGSSYGDSAWYVPLAFDIRCGAAAFVKRQQVSADWLFKEQLAFYNNWKLEKEVDTQSSTRVNDHPPFHGMWMPMLQAAGQSTVSPFSWFYGAALFGDYDHNPGYLVPPQGTYLGAFSLPYYYQDSTQAFGCLVTYNRLDGTTALSFVAISDFIVPDQFVSNRADGLGFKYPLAMAARDGVLLYSGPAGFSAWNTGTFTCNEYATKSSLKTLTGVTGTEARFHPIWLLGQPPRH
ncbi:MAG: hypothetical protein JSS23_00145 [Proteobacteria bacterium]|nr:hypothetical protein [Pseudomonadota bacterium]